MKEANALRSNCARVHRVRRRCRKLAVVDGQAPASRRRHVSAEERRRPADFTEGKWVAYVVSTTDSAKDKTDSDIWMTRLGRRTDDSGDVVTRWRELAALESRRTIPRVPTALADEAGLPPGVFSIVTGDAADAPAIGGEMTSNPIVRKLGFTGSTEVGKLLMAQCAGQVKKVSLELGGNAPFIVFDDADLDRGDRRRGDVQVPQLGPDLHLGQPVPRPGRHLRRLRRRVHRGGGALKVADGFTEGVQVGPLIDEPAVEKVERHVADALDQGAELRLGGSRIEGQFFQPSVLTGVTMEMAMSCEETFGPVAGINRFSTEAEAVAIANDTPYGLSAYFYTQDLGRTWRVAEALDYGIVGINTGLHLDRGGAVRRRQGVGHRARGLELRRRRLGRAEIPRYRRHRGANLMVIVEQRDYHVFTGKLPELVRLYEDEGIAIQQEVLGGFLGAFTTDIGALSTYTSMWRYDSFAEREERRAALQARDDWKAFLAKIQPLIHTQQNRILTPTSFSPIR